GNQSGATSEPTSAEIKTKNQGELSQIKKQVEVKKEEAAKKRLEFQDKKEKMAEEKCKNIEKKVATRANRYENNAQMTNKVYGNMKTRLDRLTSQLKSAGADTTQLEKDLVTLYAKIEKLKTDQAAYIATIKESQVSACGKTEGEFKTKITEARKVPELVKTARADIKNFFQTTIKADLQAIRATLTEEESAEVKSSMPKP
ncbi:MAG TPA: hypothetical protein DEA27_03860, partial [Candidatus Moranbacteria bacterium]|nr:hypothetical protein [Candidatus Moranbacteria bacterium]